MNSSESRLCVCALASGSKGNCTYVGCGDTHLLIDCGISAMRINRALVLLSEKLDRSITLSDISGILVTHEHADHIKTLVPIARKYGIHVYAGEPTLQAVKLKLKAGDKPIPESQLRGIEAGQELYFGDMTVTPFPIPHDAACPLGYRIDAGEASFALATDIGYLTDSWMQTVLGSQVVILEANHDPDMLTNGEYPEKLKERIRSRHGHLSNEEAGRAAVRLVDSGTRALLLGHISENNNTPELAMRFVCGALSEAGIQIGMEQGSDVFVEPLSQDTPGRLYRLDCTAENGGGL